MRTLQLRAFGGPSLYDDAPVLVARLTLDGAPAAPDLPARLGRWLGPQGAGGDGASLDPVLDADAPLDTAWAQSMPALTDGVAPQAHAVAAAVRALAARAGVPCAFVRAAPGPDAGTHEVVVAYEVEQASRLLLASAVEAVAALVSGGAAPDADDVIERARALASAETLGPTTRSLVDAAERRGIPWERVGLGSVVRLGWGRHLRFIQASVTSQSSAIAVEVSCDKPLAKELLDRALLPTARGTVVRSAGEAVEAAEALGYPVVVKPLDGNHGRGVSVGLATPDAVAEAYAIAREHGRRALVEVQLVGKDYRVLVVNGRVVAAAERRPAQVVGDGVHTLAELVELVNADPRRGEGHELPMTRIRLDDVALASLAARGLTPDDVPDEGEEVVLCRTANLSRGGTAHDVTDELHPAVRLVCERAARIVGLDVCGVDLVAPSVAEPLGKGAGIVELNASPGLRMHLFPSEGRPRDVGSAILEGLYPPGAPSRVPLLAITGTNGKTTTTRMIGHALERAGRCVGTTTTDGVWVGGEPAAHGDTTGPASARAVLADPAVEVAVLETARGGIVRRGLGWDWCDVAVLTNVSADHLGQDGIRSVDDLYRIKRRIAERTRPGGTLVLNADDERLARLPDDPAVRGVERRVVYFSLSADSAVVERHRRAGGCAFFPRNGWIVEAEGERERRIVRVAELPVTMGGAARFQVANALAACAALRAHGLAPEHVAAGLRTFGGCTHNAGRANLYRLGEGYVMLDYGHNPGAFESVCALAAHWRRTRRVTGIVGVPGDREDAVIVAAGRAAAAGFDRVIVREDDDLRGRASGETARLLCQTIHAEHSGADCEVITDEVQALRHELEAVRHGDVVVVFFEKAGPLRTLLAAEGAVPAEAVAERVPEAAGRRVS